MSAEPGHGRVGELRRGAGVVADLLAIEGETDDLPAFASWELEPATVTALDRLSVGDPVLRWSVLAAAAAVVLRRLGATVAVPVLTGEPLEARASVLLTPPPGAGFGAWVDEVRVAAAAACSPGGTEFPEGRAPLAVGRTAAASVVLDLDDTWLCAESAEAPAYQLEYFVDGVAAVLRDGLADSGVPLAFLGVLDERMRRPALTEFTRPCPGAA
ncbi:hypothetical protein [Amycolatopsis anabasis]|uniref:hypothetical protein n=1 Tax=Amycolatopsis anabasis TaxID=1840409 RepID=UPI00131B1130|nr:hypothetical protein [Amycolatopsis anabasis]